MATALVLAAYAATMSRDLSAFDGAELALVAVQGGLGHPIGQPLHTSLGWLLSHLPVLPALVGLNLLSALPTALLVVPLMSLAEALASSDGRGPASGSSWTTWLAPATLASLLLHPVPWENGSRVEVYALASLCAVWALARGSAMLARGDRPWRGGLTLGVAFGLAASANAYIALIAAVSLGPALVAALVRRRLSVRNVLSVVVGGTAGLLPYLYVPLAAQRGGAAGRVFVWGLPVDGPSLWRYFTGADYSHNRQVSGAEVLGHGVQWCAWAAESGLLPILVLGLAVHLCWGHRAGLGRGAAALGLTLTVALLASNAIFWPEVPDYAGYLTLPYSLVAAGAAALVGRVAQGSVRRQALGLALALALAFAALATPPQLLGRTRHRDRVVRLLAEGVLRSAPPRAVIVAGSDHWVFPLLYLQQAEGLRPDVTVLASGLAGSSWYWPQLLGRHPDLVPVPLREPGGTPGRIRRLLAANPSRPVLFESWEMARSVGAPACVGPWLIMDRQGCGAGGPWEDAMTPTLERALGDVGAGSPVTDRIVARVALDRGEALWRFDQPRAALRALLAGLGPDLRSEVLPLGLEAAPPLGGPPLRWRDQPMIGDPSHNVSLALHLLVAGGARDQAARLLRAALAAGMTPETELR